MCKCIVFNACNVISVTIDFHLLWDHHMINIITIVG